MGSQTLFVQQPIKKLFIFTLMNVCYNFSDLLAFLSV